ncbi:hypothetical protein ACTNEO_04945 [Gracilibacillus sp. HCP3S3_G5_1]|uniref:hypothetical protein n=1 Tax=unclassified Gracilibacillus TaxID=2625209 RepID=UPI003F8C77B5
MKKYIFFLLLFFVVACSNDGASNELEADDQEQAVEVTTDEEDVQKDEEKDTEDDRSEEEIEREGELIDIGQTIDRGDHKVELLNIKELNDQITAGPLEIDFVNAKIIKMSAMSEDIKYILDNYVPMSDREELDYIQLRLDVENTSDQDIVWDGVSDLVTDKKEQVDGIKREFISDENNKYLGNVKKELVLGFIVDDSDINDLRILFNRIYKDTFEEIEDTFEYKLTFD